MYKIVLTAVICLGFLLRVSAQHNGPKSLNGKVTESSTGEGLEYAQVAVYKQKDSSLLAGTISLADGTFSVPLAQPQGKVFAEISFIGYEKVIIRDIILPKSAPDYNMGSIALHPEQEQLEEIAVVGDKPAVSYKLDKKVIDVSSFSGANTGTAVDVLDGVASVSTDIDGNVNLRGSSAFSVMIDGRLSPLSGSDALAQLPASAISKIEIITNPSVKYDPDGTSGIINIITKKGALQGHSAMVNLSLSSLPSAGADLNYSYTAKRFIWSITLGYRDGETPFIKEANRSYKLDTEPRAELNSSEEGIRRRRGMFARPELNILLSDKNRFWMGYDFSGFLFARSYDANIYTTYRNGTEAFERSNQDFQVERFNHRVTVGDKQTFGNTGRHFLSASVQIGTGNSLLDENQEQYETDVNYNPLQIENVAGSAQTGGYTNQLRTDAEYAVPVSEYTDLESGASLRIDTYDREYTSGDLLLSADFNRTISAAWLLYSAHLPLFDFSAGVRAEHTDRNISQDANNFKYSYLGYYPSFAISREFDKDQVLAFNYSKRINRPRDYHLNPFPRLSDSYSAFRPNPELEPEYAHSFECSYQRSWKKNFFALEGFYRYTDNEMERVEYLSQDTLVRTIINLGSEIKSGAELSGQFSPLQPMQIMPVYTLYWQQESGAYNDEETTAVGIVQEARLSITYRLGLGTKFQVDGRYKGPEQEVDGKKQASAWMSASVKQDFFDRKLSLRLGVEDIFASRIRESYTDTDTYYLETLRMRQGRSLMFSASYRFNRPPKEQRRNGGADSGDGEMDF